MCCGVRSANFRPPHALSEAIKPQMSATSTPLPAGITPPYAAINDHDQSGLIAILAGFSLGLVLLSAGIRMYARRYSGDYRIDDYTIFAAVVSCSDEGVVRNGKLMSG